MERSLTVLLPVQDAQFTLAATVQEILEVLPELTSRFELVIVDDGSTDSTIEVADELANEYPQIRILRHSSPQGRAAAIAAGLKQSHGDVVFVRDDDCRLPISEAPRLWRAMDHHEVALGRVAPPPHLKTTRRPMETPHEGGFQMVKRTALTHLAQALHHQTALVNALDKLAARWHEVEIPGRPGRSISAIDSPSGPTSKPARPNYLARVKDRCSGE